MTSFKQFQKISINIWVNFNSRTNCSIVISKSTSSTPVFEIGYRDDGNGFVFGITDSNGNSFSLRSASDITLGQWYMLTLTYDQNELKGYVNAQVPGSVTTNGNALYDGELGIDVGRLEGKAFDFRVYDYTLTATEIEELYKVVTENGTLTSSQKPI